jgi:hypothetical protein
MESRNICVESRHNKAVWSLPNLEALNAHYTDYSMMLSIIV